MEVAFLFGQLLRQFPQPRGFFWRGHCSRVNLKKSLGVQVYPPNTTIFRLTLTKALMSFFKLTHSDWLQQRSVLQRSFLLLHKVSVAAREWRATCGSRRRSNWARGKGRKQSVRGGGVAAAAMNRLEETCMGISASTLHTANTGGHRSSWPCSVQQQLWLWTWATTTTSTPTASVNSHQSTGLWAGACRARRM